MTSKTYRPPMSSDEDSDDDYFEGFSSGHEFEKKPKRASTSYQSLQVKKENDDYMKILEILTIGDVDELRQYLMKRDGTNDESKIKYDVPLKGGWPIMLHAVHKLQYNLVRYLIEKGANVNCQSDSLTPLMVLCKNTENDTDTDTMIEIAKMLLESGAVVNIRDKTGYTPLMFACEHGNKEIVTLLMCESALDATDNFGKTPLFHAIENNHIEIVKILLKADVDTKIANYDGMKPRQVAASMGFTDIEELFEDETDENDVPLRECTYDTYQDIAPTIFPEHSKPAYLPDVSNLLCGMRVKECFKQFYDAKVNLPELLTMDDAKLSEIGIDFEYKRKRILYGLLKFHLHPFSPSSIQLVKKTEHKNMYQYYEMYAGYLKHLMVMNATITYLLKMNGQNNLDKEISEEIVSILHVIQKNVHSLRSYVQHISKYSQKNPLYVGPNKESLNQRYNKIVSPILKYTIVLGMGLFFSYKLTRFFT